MTILRAIKIIFTLFLLLGMTSGYAETEYEKGWDYFKNGNYSAAKKIWTPLAKQGDGDAALGLAIIYENGLQTTKDPVQSTRWYQIAADQGIAEALHDLGIKYFTGSGVTKNLDRTFELWKQASEAGLSSAQTKLAYLYLNGLGTKKDETEALRWYRQAADQGNTESMYNLSLMYKNGTGAAKNTRQFNYWLQQAAENDYPQAQFDLGLMMLYGKDIDRSVSGGKNLLVKAADNGLVDAQYYLGTLYLNGHVLRPDKDSAVRLFNAAAKQGHKGAKQALLDMKYLKSGGSGRIQSGQILHSSSNNQTAESRQTKQTSGRPKNVVLNQSLVDSPATKPSVSTPPVQTQASWLLRQNADHFTIQLIASQDPAAIKRFQQQLPKNLKPFTYHFRRDKKIWIAVASGVYADHEEASRAIKSLPLKIRKTKPWIRNIGLLQDIVSK